MKKIFRLICAGLLSGFMLLGLTKSQPTIYTSILPRPGSGYYTYIGRLPELVAGLRENVYRNLPEDCWIYEPPYAYDACDKGDLPYALIDLPFVRHLQIGSEAYFVHHHPGRECVPPTINDIGAARVLNRRFPKIRHLVVTSCGIFNYGIDDRGFCRDLIDKYSNFAREFAVASSDDERKKVFINHGFMPYKVFLSNNSCTIFIDFYPFSR